MTDPISLYYAYMKQTAEHSSSIDKYQLQTNSCMFNVYLKIISVILYNYFWDISIILNDSCTKKKYKQNDLKVNFNLYIFVLEIVILLFVLVAVYYIISNNK